MATKTKKVLGIYSSPRVEGNTDLLLDKILAGVKDSGGIIQTLFIRDFKISACKSCNNCKSDFKCIIKDDMSGIYDILESIDIVIVSSPVFFMGFPSQLKALIDRCQCLWHKNKDSKKQNGKGYLVSVGATKGESLFLGCNASVKYFFNAIGKEYSDNFLIRNVDEKGGIKKDLSILDDAYNFGKRVIS